MSNVGAAPSTVLVLMVQDQTRLLAKSLAHHVQFFDRIVLIDHASLHDLRALSHPKIDVIRVNLKPYLQVIYRNAVIQLLDLDRQYDWIFLLDVDEFLNASPNQFTERLRSFRKASYVRLFWLNGIETEFLSDAPSDASVLCYRQPLTVQKIAVNTRAMGDFIFLSGAHRVKDSRWSKAKRLFRRPVDFGINLVHLPIGNRDEFRGKLAQPAHPKGTFRDKVFRNRSAAYQDVVQSFIDTGDVSVEEAVQMAAFYRWNDREGEVEIAPGDLMPVDLFSSNMFTDELSHIEKMLDDCPVAGAELTDASALRAFAQRKNRSLRPADLSFLGIDPETRELKLLGTIPD